MSVLKTMSAGFRSLLNGVVILLLLGAALPASAENCSDFPNGIIDGDTGISPPSQIQVDRTCTVRNFPADNPLSTNFSFFTQPGQNPERWLIIFDNVVHTGQMSCNSVQEHKIWFTNGSSTAIQEGCQNLLIPVEKIDKAVEGNASTAAIGVPFSYVLTMPVLFDAGTGTVINDFGSLNDLHGVALTDDLNATGADLTYVSHQIYWESSGLPVTHTFNNDDGFLSFNNFPIIPANEQIVVEITVVLDDTPSNSVGTQFINTAKWDFGRLIDGVFYEPLPGEWGISPPLTIAGPNVLFTKTGPAVLNLGQTGVFTLDVFNSGNGDAWNLTLVDQLPDGPQGGMCDTTPQITSAQVFAADGVTPVPGKQPLVDGVDYTFEYENSPRCEFTVELLTPASTIGPNEHLIIRYATELDANTGNGVTLTNVAGAAQWYNGDDSNPDREAYSRPVNNGSVNQLDHQDAHTVTTALTGYFFEKTVENLTDGVYPASAAGPGDTLRYTVRLQTTDSAINNVEILDDLGAMNTSASFVPGSFAFAGSLPPGANTSATNLTGGTYGEPAISIANLSLPTYSELSVQFDVTLSGSLLDGQLVTNQADLVLNGIKLADSDNPFVNGQADPDVAGDEDPTVVAIQRIPPPTLAKAITQTEATIGETFSYTITVPETPHTEDVFDVRILDDLASLAADLEFVSVSKLSGSGAWTPTNTGTATNLIIEDPALGIDIPAGEQVTVELVVRLQDTPANVDGLSFQNSAYYTYNQIDSDGATERPTPPVDSDVMTVVEPELTMDKSGALTMRFGQPGTFQLDVNNAGSSVAYNLTISDQLPSGADGGMCDASPVIQSVQVFESDGTTAAGPALVDGVDYSFNFLGDPGCSFEIQILTANGAVDPGQYLRVSYTSLLDVDTITDASLTNLAGVTEWFSLSQAPANAAARTYTRLLTDGTVNTVDHEDAHITVEFLPQLAFQKVAYNITSGESPATLASPGDVIRYVLSVENISGAAVNDFSINDELDALNAVPAFVPGTLNIVAMPDGADASNTDPNGGVSGTGYLDVRNLDLGGPGGTLSVEFEVQLAPVLANDSYVSNQSEAQYFGFVVALSDDPNVNGVEDPNVDGDEDPTRLLIQSAPLFNIDKVSSYLEGDPNILLAGERLRYTITVQNAGSDNATGVELVDQLPANVDYLLNSTTLNGILVPDVNGTMPLVDGISINSADTVTPGAITAVAASGESTTATITFDVVVYDNLADGTVLSNQAFVSAADYGLFDLPSDDPRTAIVDDPTQDVVGNAPLMFAAKSAALLVDNLSPGIVDPGDVLQYTIQVYNNGTIPATYAELQDLVPANTTWVADSLTLNGLPVGQPDGAVSPLIDGIAISSADLTPPLPGVGEGTINPGESAIVQFELLVDATAIPGTVISNQAIVRTAELGTTLTDGDGNPATGPEPTVVVVGDAQQLSILKSVTVVGGGPALAGSILEYLVTVTNIGSVPALYVAITDDLDELMPGYLSYVDQSARMNGLPNGVSFAGTTVTADFFNEYGPLPAGETVTLRFRAAVNPDLAIGTPVANLARVGWNDPLQYLTAQISLDLGGTPGTGMISGEVFHDTDHDGSPALTERRLVNWTVELLRNGNPIGRVQTDSDGTYAIAGIAPNYLNEDDYSLRFVAPNAGANTALLGVTDSDFTDTLQQIDDIVVQGGSNLRAMNLPIDPNGVVYDSIGRAPIAGATVRMLDAANGFALPSACFDDPTQQGQVTSSDGWYRFDTNFSDPSCPSGSGFLLDVAVVGSYYVPGASELIPPATDASTLPFDVPSCPASTNDAVPATAQHCEVQVSETAPGSSIPGQSAATLYHYHLTLDDSSIPGSSQIFNNHIPLDPDLSGFVTISKSTPMLNVNRGQLVPYVLTVNSSFGLDLENITVVDRFPAGFKYVPESALIDGIPVEPTVAGRELMWTDLTLVAGETIRIKLLLAVGGGVAEGEFVNRAQVMSQLTGSALSEEASATVRIVPDPTFDCTDVTGKVFEDSDLNGFQDAGEEGIPGARLVTARGLAATTDQHGRYHFTCAAVPNEFRGSNFVLKIDDRSLPSGFRPTTRAVKIERATRGKALRINFAAAIHRVVGMDLSDPVFEPGSVEVRPQWQYRLGMLISELQKRPSILRLAYVADVEEEALVKARIKHIQEQVENRWEESGAYKLVIEPEIFWRLGGPPETPKMRKE